MNAYVIYGFGLIAFSIAFGGVGFDVLKNRSERR